MDGGLVGQSQLQIVRHRSSAELGVIYAIEKRSKYYFLDQILSFTWLWSIMQNRSTHRLCRPEDQRGLSHFVSEEQTLESECLLPRPCPGRWHIPTRQEQSGSVAIADWYRIRA